MIKLINTLSKINNKINSILFTLFLIIDVLEFIGYMPDPDRFTILIYSTIIWVIFSALLVILIEFLRKKYKNESSLF